MDEKCVEKIYCCDRDNNDNDKCDIIRAGQDNTQRIIDTLNNHWKDEQAREIQDLKAVISQKEQTDIFDAAHFPCQRLELE